MTVKKSNSRIQLCSDNELLYNENRTQFPDGEGLLFDELYRLAHLPLVAPNHPRVINTKPGTSYNKGIHRQVFSIAIPVYWQQLQASQEFKTLCAELEASGFSHKLSWDTFFQRTDKLHATICGTISTGTAPSIGTRLTQELIETGPVSISIRGLFSGNMNVGRLYLKVYPERRAGENMIHVIQQLFDTPATNLYLVGLFNFTDELDASEAQELKSLLNRWRDIEFMQIQLQELWLLESRDDLVLDGSIEQAIPIAGLRA